MRPVRLRDALRKARIEAADRTGVVVELRDAEVARLEILNEALDPLFAQVPEQGRPVRSRHQPGRNAAAVDRRCRAYPDGPRQAHLPLRAGHPLRPHRARRSHDVPVIVDAVTDYVARRMIEREHAHGRNAGARAGAAAEMPRRRGFGTFVLGFIVGVAGAVRPRAVCGAQELERFRAKWAPVRVKKTRQFKIIEPRF